MTDGRRDDNRLGGLHFDFAGAGGHADAVTELRLRLVALESALASTERVLQPSLVEFLR